MLEAGSPARSAHRGAVLAALAVLAAGTGDAPAQGRERAEPLIAPRLLHYPLQCRDGEFCQIECFQGGRVVVSRIQVDPADTVILALTDGFSDRLDPLWIAIRPASGSNPRTILLPRDVLCDLQGLTVQPLDGG